MTRAEYLALREARVKLQVQLVQVVDAGKRAARLALRASAKKHKTKQDMRIELQVLGKMISDTTERGTPELLSDSTHGYDLVDALLEARARELFAWRDLNHEDTMAVLQEDRARREATTVWLTLPSPRPGFDEWFAERRSAEANASQFLGADVTRDRVALIATCTCSSPLCPVCSARRAQARKESPAIADAAAPCPHGFGDDVHCLQCKPLAIAGSHTE